MAIDGTKIIDSDLAHDIYSKFMDLYDAGFDINDIRKDIDKYRTYDLDEEEYEIFITVYCLALWEIGYMDSDIFKELVDTICKGAGVKEWLEESKEASEQRQKELTKLVKKLSNSKINLRRRKKYRFVTNFIFSENDVVIFQANDQKYRASILAEIKQYRGSCSYHFTALDYIDTEFPNIAKLLNSNILIREIGSGYSREETKKRQPEVEELWENKNHQYFIGLVYHSIEHKDLLRFRDKFIKIGQIVIKEQFKSFGSIGCDSEYNNFVERNFGDIDEYLKIFGGKKIPIQKIINDV